MFCAKLKMSYHRSDPYDAVHQGESFFEVKAHSIVQLHEAILRYIERLRLAPELDANRDAVIRFEVVEVTLISRADPSDVEWLRERIANV